MNGLRNNRGFTLVEIMIAIFLIATALLGLISTTAMITKGNAFSKTMTTATTLAQDRMEELTNRSFANITPGGPETVQPIYTRSWAVTNNSPALDMKTIVVTVTWPWQGIDRTVTIKNLVGS